MMGFSLKVSVFLASVRPAEILLPCWVSIRAFSPQTDDINEETSSESGKRVCASASNAMSAKRLFGSFSATSDRNFFTVSSRVWSAHFFPSTALILSETSTIAIISRLEKLVCAGGFQKNQAGKRENIKRRMESKNIPAFQNKFSLGSV